MSLELTEDAFPTQRLITLVDTSDGTWTGLGLGRVTRIGFTSHIDSRFGFPISGSATGGFFDPWCLRWHDLQQRTPINTPDRRMSIQLVADYEAEQFYPRNKLENPYHEDYWTSKNRTTRVTDTQNRVAILTSMMRPVDSHDGKYALGLTIASRELTDFAVKGRTGALSEIEPLIAGQPTWIPEAALPVEEQGTRTRGQEPELIEINDNRPLGYVWGQGFETNDTSARLPVASLLDTVFMPLAQGGVFDVGRERTPIGPLPIRHDAQFAMGPLGPNESVDQAGDIRQAGVGEADPDRGVFFQSVGGVKVGRIRFANNDAGIIPDIPGTLFRGELWFDEGLADEGSQFGGETGQWVPVIRVNADIESSSSSKEKEIIIKKEVKPEDCKDKDEQDQEDSSDEDPGDIDTGAPADEARLAKKSEARQSGFVLVPGAGPTGLPVFVPLDAVDFTDIAEGAAGPGEITILGASQLDKLRNSVPTVPLASPALNEGPFGFPDTARNTGPGLTSGGTSSPAQTGTITGESFNSQRREIVDRAGGGGAPFTVDSPQDQQRDLGPCAAEPCPNQTVGGGIEGVFGTVPVTIGGEGSGLVIDDQGDTQFVITDAGFVGAGLGGFIAGGTTATGQPVFDATGSAVGHAAVIQSDTALTIAGAASPSLEVQENIATVPGGALIAQTPGNFNVANYPIPQFGQPGSPKSVDGYLRFVGHQMRSIQRTILGAFGGPKHLESNIALVARNRGSTPTGHHLGTHFTASKGVMTLGTKEGRSTRHHSILEAKEDAQIVAEGGGVFEFVREHRGGGQISDDRPLILLENDRSTNKANIKADYFSNPDRTVRLTHDEKFAAKTLQGLQPFGSGKQNVLELGFADSKGNVQGLPNLAINAQGVACFQETEDPTKTTSNTEVKVWIGSGTVFKQAIGDPTPVDLADTGSGTGDCCSVIFGNEDDGDVTYSISTSVSNQTNNKSITVNDTVTITIDIAQFRVTETTTFIGSADIDCDGQGAVGTTGGMGSTGGAGGDPVTDGNDGTGGS